MSQLWTTGDAVIGATVTDRQWQLVDEALLIELRLAQQTPPVATDCVSGWQLAHVGRWQGRRARY